MSWPLSLILLVVLYFFSLTHPGRFFLIQKKHLIFFILIAVFFIKNTLSSYFLYVSWAQDSFAYYFLPPYTPFTYFIRYSLTHYWFNFLLSVIFAYFALIFFQWLNRRRNHLLFQPDELYFPSFIILILGHPAWLIFLILTPIAFILYSLLLFLINKKTDRVSFYHLFYPLAFLSLTLHLSLLHSLSYSILGIGR